MPLSTCIQCLFHFDTIFIYFCPNWAWNFDTTIFWHNNFLLLTVYHNHLTQNWKVLLKKFEILGLTEPFISTRLQQKLPEVSNHPSPSLLSGRRRLRFWATTKRLIKETETREKSLILDTTNSTISKKYNSLSPSLCNNKN